MHSSDAHNDCDDVMRMKKISSTSRPKSISRSRVTFEARHLAQDNGNGDVISFDGVNRMAHSVARLTAVRRAGAAAFSIQHRQNIRTLHALNKSPRQEKDRQTCSAELCRRAPTIFVVAIKINSCQPRLTQSACIYSTL